VASRSGAIRMTGEAGMTLVEVLVGIIILGIGVMATLSVFFAAGRFSEAASHENTAARIVDAVFDYSLADPAWATAGGGQQSNQLDPIVTPMDGLVWSLEATPPATHHPGDDSYTNVWLLKLKVAADADDDGSYDASDWASRPVRPRGFVKYGNLDCSCETYIYKE